MLEWKLVGTSSSSVNISSVLANANEFYAFVYDISGGGAQSGFQFIIPKSEMTSAIKYIGTGYYRNQSGNGDISIGVTNSEIRINAFYRNGALVSGNIKVYYR